MGRSAIELSAIYIYPVKSLRGVSLRDAALDNGRLVGDREYLLVGPSGWFMHQRDYPQMTRIEATPTDGGLVVRTAALPPLEIERPSAVAAGDVVHVPLWRRSAPVTPVSHEADAWFSRALGVRCRLMAFVPEVPALHLPSYETNSSLQDATPFHLTSESSLADLNARMGAPIQMNRFRPNLVVRGAVPYAEDDWRRISIGETTLEWVKPCTRCVATTTDQETGHRENREPLYTLASYRRVGNEVVFGHYLVATAWGDRLRVGDAVAVHSIADSLGAV